LVACGCGYQQEADRLARCVGAVSINEEVEDIATADLKFVLTNFYLGALELKGNLPFLTCQWCDAIAFPKEGHSI